MKDQLREAFYDKAKQLLDKESDKVLAAFAWAVSSGGTKLSLQKDESVNEKALELFAEYTADVKDAFDTVRLDIEQPQTYFSRASQTQKYAVIAAIEAANEYVVFRFTLNTVKDEK